MKIAKDISQIIGGTPLVELARLSSALGVETPLIAKVESMNPAGSIKDRTALSMLNDAEARGILRAGGTVIEPTSGNTGIGLAAVAAARGYKVMIVMPDNMSKERILTIKAYGAEIVLTDGEKGMQGAIDKAEELKKEIPDSFIAGQFTNPANAMAHYRTTGPEIYEDTDGEVDYFVAGVGTGGTITGTGHFLKEKKPDVRVIAVEPSGSPVLSGGKSGPHGLQGIGAGFIPEVLDTGVYDEVITVSDEEAFETGRMLGKTEGILSGISSGAALKAAIDVAKRPEAEGKAVVVLLPDTGDRYLSTELFA